MSWGWPRKKDGNISAEKQEKPVSPARAVQTGGREEWNPWDKSGRGPGPAERQLYRLLRENIPIIDAALGKIVRLTGGFQVLCEDKALQEELEDFIRTVQVNTTQQGLQSFLDTYLEQLLLYGTAVGEMVPDGNGSIGALYNASLESIELHKRTPLDVDVRVRDKEASRSLLWPELILISALHPEPGQAWGVSLLRSLPFVSQILMKIYRTMGINWDRVGDVRFAVTYRPADDTDRAFARERATQIAEEWQKAMRSEYPTDFVSVGDVEIRTIGADGKELDSQIPVRQMLEQIVAKLGVPPFLLGLSWSSTERMSSQQADILTSELEFYRRLLEPVIRKVCAMWLSLKGRQESIVIRWEDITLQDETETATARWYNARARQLEETLKGGEGSSN